MTLILKFRVLNIDIRQGRIKPHNVNLALVYRNYRILIQITYNRYSSRQD
jgi:hypothetical protein